MFLYNCVYLTKVCNMDFNVTGTTQMTRTGNANSAYYYNGVKEPEFLWEDDTVNNDMDTKETENQELQAQLAQLEAQRQAKLAEKQELLNQKKVIQARKAKIEAQIKANEEAIKANNSVIIQNQEKIEAQQKQIEKLQQQYDEKCKEAETLNEQINERIAQLLAKSEQDVQEATEKVRKATEEAYAKVESGEITEDEVAQYVSDKAGVSGLGASSADFANINAMNNQMRNLVNSAKSLSNQMIAASDLIKGFQANITSAINSNQELADKNRPLVQQLSEINQEEADINSELTRVNTEISQIDVQISEVQAKLTEQKNNQVNSPVKTTKDEETNTYDRNPATTRVESSNPFLAISYNNASFTTMVEALDAMVKANEQTISDAQATVESNNEIIRNIFQEQMKK